MASILAYLKREPVAVLDVVKALLACLILFGLPIPPGLDIALAGLVVAVLTVLTRGLVSPASTEEVDEDGPTEEEALVEEEQEG